MRLISTSEILNSVPSSVMGATQRVWMSVDYANMTDTEFTSWIADICSQVAPLCDYRLDSRVLIHPRSRRKSDKREDLPVLESTEFRAALDLARQGLQVRFRSLGWDGGSSRRLVLVDSDFAILQDWDGHARGLGPMIWYLGETYNITDEEAWFETNWDAGHTLEALYTSSRELSQEDSRIEAELGSEEMAGGKILTVSAAYWEALLRTLARNPEGLFRLEPRAFEELVAELLDREGLRVTLTPPTRDGGRDIMAFADTPLGEQLYLVECKRFSPDRPVGVRFVRELFGTLEAERATGGMLVTTSRFSPDALVFRESLRWRLSLRDYLSLSEWLKKHGTV